MTIQRWKSRYRTLGRRRESEFGDAEKDVFYRIRNRIFSTIEPEIRRSVVPIFGKQRNGFVQNRTGILFAVGSRHFLLTAAHYLDRWVQRGSCPYLFGKGELFAIGVEGMILTDPRQVDFAVLELSKATVSRLQTQRRFLRLCECDIQAKHSDTLYLLIGYPTEWAQAGHQNGKPWHFASHFSFLTTPFAGDPDPEGTSRDDWHLCIDYDGDSYNSSGQRRAAPSVCGMSGGGIWAIENWRGNAEFGAYSKPRARLVAIQSSWSEDLQYSKGTWIRCVVRTILHAYPDLRNAISIAYR